MKKITLCLAALCMTFASAQEFSRLETDESVDNERLTNASFAQQTLSHSVSRESAGSGVACRSNPDQAPASGDEGISDNIFYRAYTPEDFGFSGDFQAMGVSFIVEFNDVGGSNPLVVNNVKLFTSSDVFPAGTLTEIASQEFEVTADDDGALFEIMFDEIVVLDAATEIIVAVDIAAAAAPPSNYDFDIGRNDLGQNAPSYLSSNACGLTSPGTFAAIGFADEHLILNLIGDTFLSSNEFLMSKISVYPNPVKDVLNLELPSGIELKGGQLYDLTGKDTGLRINAKTINVSSLSTGVYLLNIETSNGSISKKVVIQ